MRAASAAVLAAAAGADRTPQWRWSGGWNLGQSHLNLGKREYKILIIYFPRKHCFKKIIKKKIHIHICIYTELTTNLWRGTPRPAGFRRERTSEQPQGPEGWVA